ITEIIVGTPLTFLRVETMTNTLREQYEEKVRPLIDLIDSLRSLGVEKDLSLPAIVVIGDQSSGKSSVLEALSGVALPRGGGITTRCPLELKMKKGIAEWHGMIRYQGHTENIEDPMDVEKKIREAQDKIAGVGVGISEDLISLEITSTDVPDLTLIDLPGITRVAVKDQPENIGDQIKRLIKKFITSQQTINLVVVPCNVDIATTEALMMAHEVDPNWERTIGILTKPDLVDKGMEETVVAIVSNEIIHLTKGYMIVKCRRQKEIKHRLSLKEAINNETAFFKDHPYFSTLYNEGKATISNLAKKLTHELVHHIEKMLPKLLEEVAVMIAKTQMELEHYGKGPPEDPTEQGHFLRDKVMAFTQDAVNLTTGEKLKTTPQTNVFSGLRENFKQWRDYLEDSGNMFNRRIEQEIQEDEIQFRGRELPGFINYKTFEVLVKEHIKQLEEPAIKSLKEISDIVRKCFIQLAQSRFVGLPNLFKTTKEKIENIKQEKEKEAESILRIQFKLENIVYTQDRTYNQSLTTKKIEEHKEEDSIEEPEYRVPGSHSQAYSTNSATLQELRQHFNAYYSIASQRLADHIPMVMLYLLQECAIQLNKDMLQMLQDKISTKDLLKEDSVICTTRTALQNRKNRLTKAHDCLVKC
uniref:Interferon-induced GTP-binding protein Mx n=2 Tax=Electrophorus electricus TaxID=8005 RepID=A0A4W4GPE9_ELEEL